MKNNYFSKIFAILCFGSGTYSAVAQNSCAQALPATAGTITVSGIDGTNTTTACLTQASMAEWYAYTPTQNYSVTVTSDLAQNICKDTRFSVYTGTCTGLVCLTSDDDSGVIACNSGNTNSFLSKKTFEVTAGVTYYIAWDNRWSAAGFDFQIIEAPIVPSPCATATTVTAGITTVNAIDGTNVNTTCSTASQAKWYKYVPTQNYRVTVSSDLPENLCKNTNFSVYTGSCSGTLTCVTSDDNSGVLECNVGNTNSFLSKKTFDVTAGTTYYIVWDNKWSAEGFNFEITEQVIVVPVAYSSQSVSTINSQYNICVIDMNDDGRDDIVGVSPNTLKVHYQNADGTFTISNITVPGTSKMPTWSLAAGDYNRDGYSDLILGSGNGLSFWQSNATGTAYTSITPGEYIFCQRTNFVDINNDGHLDAFSCHDIDPNVYYLNDGAGNFTYYQSGITPGAYNLGIIPSGGNYASLWTDFDNDGDVDMFVSKCSGPPCELHRNDGPAGYTDISATAGINVTPVQSWSSAIADFDNDGDMDILVGSNGSVKSMLFRNNLDTTNTTEEAYSNVSSGSGWDTDTTINRDYIAYDFDNDGFVDVMGSGNKIMFNQGDLTFLPTNYPSGISVGAVGDLNNDGFLDVLNGSNIRYAVPNGNKWVKVRLKGIQSNINGIGARVEVYGSWGKMIRDVRSGEGFQFMSTLSAHFGLGTATTIDKIIIRWPSGTVDTLLNPNINQTHLIVEGATLNTIGAASSMFMVYPNPVSDVLTIRPGTSAPQIKSAEIFDLNGRLVQKSDVLNNAITVKNLAAGSYILLLNAVDGSKHTQKFLKN
ncbi:hypothetical protein CHU92_04240 [Flavobacterium cyanobacteriorum]|uniref:RNA-binding protein n=1 Tax=Flavobacterium cyanobacteriorum TaxID=2022802 RepID=A0A255ZK95_9FLAO|nr:FG-GAP-like repeat-containing protein [Flavobacterium cyanobacteriorum]OYQ41977.1 hypothetical protein CHU92_04240 [Flavobacterium cyanobacteriorum]